LTETLNSKLAVEAAKYYLEIAEQARKSEINTSRFVDAIVLATARELNEKILTGDVHFKALPDAIWA
jgi:predicted nucleic acid-binding protein